MPFRQLGKGIIGQRDNLLRRRTFRDFKRRRLLAAVARSERARTFLITLLSGTCLRAGTKTILYGLASLTARSALTWTSRTETATTTATRLSNQQCRGRQHHPRHSQAEPRFLMLQHRITP
jgi:hypothetical protein